MRRKPSFHFETERPKFESPVNRPEKGSAIDLKNLRVKGSTDS